MNCKKCGNRINENAKFCTQCGTPTGPIVADHVPPAHPSSSTNTVYPVASKTMPSGMTGRKRKWFMIAAMPMVIILVATVSFMHGVRSGRDQDIAAANAITSSQKADNKKPTSKKSVESKDSKQVTKATKPVKPDIDGTWVSQGDLDRPFTLNNGVLTTPPVEGEPEKGTYTISDEPDGNGYFVLTLQFDDMNECSSTSQEKCESNSDLDINRFEIQTSDNSGSYLRSFALRPILSSSDKEHVSDGYYYSTCPWDAGYSWYNGDDEDVCAITSDAVPDNPEYWTMIRQ